MLRSKSIPNGKDRNFRLAINTALLDIEISNKFCCVLNIKYIGKINLANCQNGLFSFKACVFKDATKMHQHF